MSYLKITAYGFKPIKDCVGVTEFSSKDPPRYDLRKTLSLSTSPTQEVSYVKIVGKPSGSSIQWSGKHVGKYLAEYTSYGKGRGSRTFLYLLVQIIDLTRLLSSPAGYQESFENPGKSLSWIWRKQRPNVLN